MYSLKTRLSGNIFIVVLITIAMISILSNYFINREFTDYISRQQELKTQVITTGISRQYTKQTKQWNLDYIHAVGMSSLYEGYIIKVTDLNGTVLWDARAHDMRLCNQIMDEISQRMDLEYPQLNGEFTSADYPLEQGGETVGSVNISYFGPFFLNENEFRFLHSLNTVLLSVGAVSLIFSLVVGHIVAKGISLPVLRTVEAAKQISDGNYEVRLQEETGTSELKLLVDSVNHMAQSLETMERLRKQLTGDVAHELRTPITVLQTYLEAMTEGIWEADRERLLSCYDEVVRMGRLVGDLESLAKLEGELPELKKENTDLYELIHQITVTFGTELQKHRMEVTVSGPHPQVPADRDRIRQVAINLLENAIKYSGEGSRIAFELFETDKNAGFAVRDNGIGIPEEELPFIFERFYRADKSRNRMTGGTGIGLTIVKSIVQAHGGMITAESTINLGSTFTVTLPK